MWRSCSHQTCTSVSKSQPQNTLVMVELLGRLAASIVLLLQLNPDGCAALERDWIWVSQLLSNNHGVLLMRDLCAELDILADRRDYIDHASWQGKTTISRNGPTKFAHICMRRRGMYNIMKILFFFFFPGSLGLTYCRCLVLHSLTLKSIYIPLTYLSLFSPSKWHRII